MPIFHTTPFEVFLGLVSFYLLTFGTRPCATSGQVGPKYRKEIANEDFYDKSIASIEANN